MDYDTLAGMLGEGFHTAFRKATDHPLAMPIHRIISQLPKEDWAAIIKFTAEPVWEALQREREVRGLLAPAEGERVEPATE